MSVSSLQRAKIHRELKKFQQQCKVRATRTLLEFAEQSIVIPPGGPHAKKKFSVKRQPWTKLWYEMIQSRRFNRHALLGGQQGGKSLNGFVIPALWHLFEIVENVGVCVPDDTMAFDKWERDFKPVIMASEYRDQIPTTGAGSRGGEFDSITFRNGAVLKFLKAGGDDKKRAGATFRVLVMTEIDGFDEAGKSSREADKISQMEGRLNAFETMNTVVYLECTVSIETGRIWQEHTVKGSGGEIVVPCPHCCEYVTPEREHLVGWQDADNELDAREMGYFCCPSCKECFTEEQRIAANHNAKVIHRGQSIDKNGVITGEIPRTLTGSLRWSGFNNLFRPTKDFAGKEFVGKQDVSEENAAKSLEQFVWVKPAKATKADFVRLEIKTLLDRTHKFGRGVVPPGCDTVVMGLDLGGWYCHWTAVAYGPRARGYVVDYGRIAVPQQSIGVEAGLMEAMREFRTIAEAGFQRTDGMLIIPDENLIDSGWSTTIAYDFIRETGYPFTATKGLSVGGEKVSYTRPKSTGNIVLEIGDGWHIVDLEEDDIELLEIDADWAKTTLHSRLSCDLSAPGAVTFFEVDRRDHVAAEERRQFMKHLTAEKATQEFVKGRGNVTRWEKIRRDNHWLDSTALCITAGSVDGISVIEAMADEVPAHDRQDDEQVENNEPSGQVAEQPVEEPAPTTQPPKKGGWARKGA